jgi:hypothetical protein
VIPLVLSIAALWFAYKSNVISREWADAHLRITTLTFLGIPNYDGMFEQDGNWLIPGNIGSFENTLDILNDITIATNELGMSWMNDAIGLNPDEMNMEYWPYNQYFVYLSITNDGDQIAEDVWLTIDYYDLPEEDYYEGEFREEDHEPEEKEFGPYILAPGSWLMIPLGTTFVKTHPDGSTLEFINVGDFYVPRKIKYLTAVSGDRVTELDMHEIPVITMGFTDPIEMLDEQEDKSSGDNGNYPEDDRASRKR